MNDTITIRKAALADSETLANLSRQLGYYSTTQQIKERLEGMAILPHHAVFVAETQEHAVVGWAHVKLEFHLESGVFAELVGLVVDEQCRGKRIGSMLLQAAEQWTKQAGYLELSTRTNTTRPRTHKFYEHRGYQLKKQQNVYYKMLG